MLNRHLDEMYAEWVRLGAPIVDLLRPGLSEQQVDAVGRRLGLTVPDELRQLWIWRDGTDWAPHRDIGPGAYEFLSTEEVIEVHASNLEVHAVSPEPSLLPNWYWHKSWIPFMTAQAERLYIDAQRQGQHGDTPVRLVSHTWEDFEIDRAPSLTAAVSMWLWLLRSDFYHWPDGVLSAPVDEQSIPLFVRLTLG